jgi:hypothetical protein
MSLNNRSAFVSVPGKDALVEYEAKSYPVKAYVERNGLIFKSVSATSETFILSQWELVGDLREVRVPTIAARNTLTGTTGTSYGVHIPILDNTNVLVLDASGDPEVGSAQFARYNYNQGDASWLLLQIGTGATSASTSIEYANVLNRPFVVSGVTVNAGAGLSGGGAVFGSIPAAGGVINIAHADTSTQANLVPTGRTYVQQLKFDTYGHVTGATQSTWTHPDTSSQANVLNTGRTYIQSISVDGDGHVTNLSSSPWVHPDTSSQASSNNAGNTFIQTIFLDGDGHVTGIGTGVAAGGGGGSSFKYNGDSGGVLTANSGATVTFSGGSNIQTVRSGNAANPGLRISFNPAGLVNQLQFNNGGGLSASSNLVFSAGTSTLRTSNLIIGSLPASGTTANDILSRDITTGAVNRLSVGTLTNTIVNNLTANNGLTKMGANTRLGGSLTGNTTISQAGFKITFQSGSVSIGSFSGTSGTNGFSLGSNVHSAGLSSVALGSSTRASGSYSFAGGFGYNNLGNTKPIVAGGSPSFNFSTSVAGTPAGVGAYAVSSAILGGASNNISAGNIYSVVIGGSANNISAALAGQSVILGGSNNQITGNAANSVILGGQNITLSGVSQVDHAVVPNLMIWNAPAAGGSNDVLTWNSITRKVGSVTQASLIPAPTPTPPAGANTQVQFNNSGAFGASGNLTFDGTTLTASNILVSGNLEVAGQAWVQQGALTDAASIVWDLNANPNANVVLAGNRALAAPTNMKAGGTYYLIVKQDATGGRTLSYASVYKWSGGVAPVLTTNGNATDILTFICDGTFMYGVVTPNLL